MDYYIHAECPKCDGDVYDRAANFAEHNGKPVFSLDQFSQYSMTCENEIWKNDKDEILDEDDLEKLSEEEKEELVSESCGYSFGTGDIEIIGEDDF